jgi:asparagine synthase (glutamine-hydrolysing)
MCGIIGVHGQTEDLKDYLSRITHRGPDGQHTTIQHNAVLGHTRLAIVDLETGDQPLQTADGSAWLVANGEVYNHEALRAEYDDYNYLTDSDSEVILALYEKHGAEAVRYLDGMFAFALVTKDDLLLARDPLGIKPLYYGWDGDTLYFGSEIKALQHLVTEIEEFPPGHWYTLKDGFTRYYNLGESTQNADEPTTEIEQIYESLREAVGKRLMADVPVGVFLSGGLDSSIIAGLVSQALPHVHSFAVGFEESEDLQYARKVAEHLGTEHHEYIYTVEEMIEALPDVIYHLESFDPSLVRSAIPNYFLSRLARQHVTVVLSGEGADELYAGYEYYKTIDTDDLHRELVMATDALHTSNLIRCDRMSMAHSLEARVPFLDTAFIDLSFKVPIEQKIYGDEPVEKWALRKAFEHLIPEEVVWRVKSQFSKGAGSSHVFDEIAERDISDADFAMMQQHVLKEAGIKIGTKEEMYYYQVFRRFFDVPSVGLVQRWRGDDGTAEALQLN